MSRVTNFALFPIALTAAILAFPTTAAAQSETFKVEITPFAGYRTGGSFDEKDGPGSIKLKDSSAAGILLNFKANANGQYEILYAGQRTDAETSGFFENDPTIELDVETLQFGGTYLFDGEFARPFIAMTLGGTRFKPGLPDVGSESFFAASFGGGLQIWARNRFGVRLEGRMYTAFVDDESSIFCGSIGGNGACSIRLDARTVTQWEAHAGLVFRF